MPDAESREPASNDIEAMRRQPDDNLVLLDATELINFWPFNRLTSQSSRERLAEQAHVLSIAVPDQAF